MFCCALINFRQLLNHRLNRLWKVSTTSKIKFEWEINGSLWAKVKKRDLEGAQGAQSAAVICSVLLPFSFSPGTENTRNSDI